MATIANITLNDGLATPVARTFTVEAGYRGPDIPAVWLYRHATTPLGHVRLELHKRRNSNGTERIGCKIFVPYVTTDAVAGPKLVSKCIFDEFSGGIVKPENATQAQIDDLVAFEKNFKAHAVYTLAARTGEMPT